MDEALDGKSGSDVTLLCITHLRLMYSCSGKKVATFTTNTPPTNFDRSPARFCYMFGLVLELRHCCFVTIKYQISKAQSYAEVIETQSFHSFVHLIA